LSYDSIKLIVDIGVMCAYICAGLNKNNEYSSGSCYLSTPYATHTVWTFRDSPLEE
jgi:hypothetical protein